MQNRSRRIRFPFAAFLCTLWVALAVCATAIAEETPRDPATLTAEGWTLIDRGENRRALAYLEKARVQRESFSTLFGMAWASHQLHELEWAQKYGERTVELAASDEEKKAALHLLSVVLFEQLFVPADAPAPSLDAEQIATFLAEQVDIEDRYRQVLEIYETAEGFGVADAEHQLHMAYLTLQLRDGERARRHLDAYRERLDPTAVTDTLRAESLACRLDLGREIYDVRSPMLGVGADSPKAEGAAELDIEAPEKVHVVPPNYTETARRAGTTGIVILSAIIDREGTPRCIDVLRGLPNGLAFQAVEAVRQWRFEPAQRDGEPVDVLYNLTINFSLR